MGKNNINNLLCYGDETLDTHVWAYAGISLFVFERKQWDMQKLDMLKYASLFFVGRRL